MGDLTLVGGLVGAHVVLRPVAPEDAPALLHITTAPELRRWRESADLGGNWPLDDGSPTTRLTILIGRRISGLIEFWEHDDPQYRYAGLDLFLDPALHGRGFGRDAVRTLARHLFDDRGHHRLVIDAESTNETAIRCFTAVGFRPIGHMRAQERHETSLRDGLAMDLLATELR